MLWAAAAGLPAVGAAAAPGPGWQRLGSTWVLSADLVPRAEAVRRLAAASGTDLSVAPGALDGLRPLRGGLRAGSLADAWGQLLSAHGAHAIQCAPPGRCRVWLLAAGPVRAAVSLASTPGAMPLADVQPTSVPRTPMEPDPPGLFPSE